MPSRTEDAALIDIKHYILVAQKIVSQLSYAEFLNDEIQFLALTRCLEIISEASRHLSLTTKDKAPDIKWVSIAAAGNVYRHDYEAVLSEHVWETASSHLDGLLAFVEAELKAHIP